MAARPCDTCKSAPALLYCGADDAFLCGACDTRIHGANPLASRHERVWVCEVCEQAPASVTCKADAAALCCTCDSDIHSANPLARRHERVPLLPFLHLPSGGASVAGDLFKASDNADFDDEETTEAEAASWLLPNPNPNAHHPKGLIDAPEMKTGEYYFPEMADPYLDLDYGAPMDSVVPVDSKAAIDAAPALTGPILAPDGCVELDFAQSKLSFSAYTTSHSVSSSEVGVVPESGETTGGGAPPLGTAAAARMDREARVMRYREKRKSRRFEKTIRYASRKAYAETRPRIKGRFAKRTEVDVEVDRFFASSGGPTGAGAGTSAFFMDPGYGVVPSF